MIACDSKGCAPGLRNWLRSLASACAATAPSRLYVRGFLAASHPGGLALRTRRAEER
jgi:hypothetical protein